MNGSTMQIAKILNPKNNKIIDEYNELPLDDDHHKGMKLEQ